MRRDDWAVILAAFVLLAFAFWFALNAVERMAAGMT